MCASPSQAPKQFVARCLCDSKNQSRITRLHRTKPSFRARVCRLRLTAESLHLQGRASGVQGASGSRASGGFGRLQAWEGRRWGAGGSGGADHWSAVTSAPRPEPPDAPGLTIPGSHARPILPRPDPRAGLACSRISFRRLAPRACSIASLCAARRACACAHMRARIRAPRQHAVRDDVRRDHEG